MPTPISRQNSLSDSSDEEGQPPPWPLRQAGHAWHRNSRLLDQTRSGHSLDRSLTDYDASPIGASELGDGRMDSHFPSMVAANRASGASSPSTVEKVTSFWVGVVGDLEDQVVQSDLAEQRVAEAFAPADRGKSPRGGTASGGLRGCPRAACRPSSQRRDRRAARRRRDGTGPASRRHHVSSRHHTSRARGSVNITSTLLRSQPALGPIVHAHHHHASTSNSVPWIPAQVGDGCRHDDQIAGNGGAYGLGDRARLHGHEERHQTRWRS